MPTRTTDNFLAHPRGKSYYSPRPILYTPRHKPVYRDYGPQLIISDSLPAKIQPKIPRLKFTFSYKKLAYAFPVIIFIFIATGLIGYKINHQPTKQTKPLDSVAAGVTSLKKVPPSSGLPKRIKIPSITVNAVFDYVGLTSQGDLDVPKGPTNAGWYNQGPRPGEVGSSVIDGHFGYKNNLPAVFDNLHKLQGGDNLYVEDEKGAMAKFVVRESRTYGPNEDATAVFRSSDGKAHLNLITCQGVWNKSQKSYSTRLVVFADKVI